MRYLAPAREAVQPQVFARPPLAAWRDHAALLEGRDWPSIDMLNARCGSLPVRFAAQTRELLADGLHYEERIARRGEVATRERNWHDLFNALVWLRYPAIKRALNARQVAEIAVVGGKQRSRAQCALTHFDEAGVLVGLRDPALLALWDAHDWHGLFWRRREAWSEGGLVLSVFGHALLEHALTPDKLLVGKALVFLLGAGQGADALADACARAIDDGRALRDPQALRPLPLSGIPGWHPGTDDEAFYHSAGCFQPLREGRRYPAALGIPD